MSQRADSTGGGSTKTESGAPVAIVTGAGRRVGEVVARYLSSGGYHVALVAHRSIQQAEQTAAELTTAGPRAIALQCDVAQEDQVRAMVRRAAADFGRIDALVNCAAIWNAAPLESTTAADVRGHFEINTLGTFLCCQQAGLVMAGQAAGGAIVNIGDWAIVRPYRDYAAYFASKGAIPALTRAMAVEWAARNPQVRVNAVLPGPVLLPETMPEAERSQVVAGTLVKREGRPENVAHAVWFFLKNDFVTGVCLPVDGGRSIYAPSDE